MVPPPSPLARFIPDWETLFLRGQRRNFYRERYQHPHKFPIGAKVYMRTPNMAVTVGPLYVVEHCKPLYPQGPPQYILQLHTNGDNSKWLQANERNVFDTIPPTAPTVQQHSPLVRY